MTLEEAIAIMEDPTKHTMTCSQGELTAWLKELKELKEENKILMSECDRLIKEKGKLIKNYESMIGELRHHLIGAEKEKKTITQILREVLPILQKANFFPDFNTKKEADSLYDKITKILFQRE